MPLELKNYDPAVMQGANIGVSVDLTDITDNNGNEVMEIDGVASAVNYLRMTNSATGSAVEISSQGDDSNISLNLTPKGTGTVVVTVGTTTGVRVTGTLGVPTVGVDVSIVGSANSAFRVASTTDTPAQPLSIGTSLASGAIKINVAGTARYVFFYT